MSNRKLNSARNALFGLLLKFYQIIMPFVMRTIMIKSMGIEYAGINNLFISILQVLSLAELGIGAALIFSMYKPLANGDTEKVNALMNLYKKTFRVLGIIILGIGIIIFPFIPKFISGEIPGELNIYILYFMYLINTSLSYFLFAYKSSLLYATQRVDISNKIMIATSTVQYILQIISIIIYHNYYFYIISSIVYQLMTNLITAYIVKKKYPQYKPKGEVSKELKYDIKKRVIGLITNKIGGTLLNSTDTIIISSMFGLTTLGVYQNYYYIITSIISIAGILFYSCLASIGNSIITESEEKNYKNFLTFNFIISYISIVCCSLLIAIYQDFIKLWVGEKYTLDYGFIFLIVVFFYIYQIEQLIGTYKDAAGIWYEDRFRSLITGIINLILSFLLGKIIGLNGVKLATILSMILCSTPWLIINLFKYIFKESNKKLFCFELLKTTFLWAIISIITYIICNNIMYVGIKGIIIKGIISIIMSNILLLIFFYRSEYKKNTINIIKNILKLKEIE